MRIYYSLSYNLLVPKSVLLCHLRHEGENDYGSFPGFKNCERRKVSIEENAHASTNTIAADTLREQKNMYLIRVDHLRTLYEREGSSRTFVRDRWIVWEAYHAYTYPNFTNTPE